MKNNKFMSVSLTVVILFAVTFSTACTRLEVLSQKVSETVVKTDGEDDYSIRYRVSVRNKGMAGKVRIKAKLYTPEGQFYREKIVKFSKDDEADLEFIFTEPTFLGSLFGEGKTRAEISYEQVN